MSVIVYADGVLASDTFANNGDNAYHVEKLWKSHDGKTLFGCIGKLQEMFSLRQWAERLDYATSDDFPENNNATLIAVTKEKGLIRYKGSAIPILHGNERIAFGEGAASALGALDMGATAEQAVTIAIRRNIHCNGEATSITFD